MSHQPSQDLPPHAAPSPMPAACVIEDEPVVRKVISKSLRERDYDTRCFESAEAFLAAVSGPGPRVLVVDKNLPGMSGIDLVDRLRQDGTCFEAILITGYADQESAIDAVRLGFYRYVRKPFDLDDLLLHVDGAARRLLRQAVPGPPETSEARLSALCSQYALIGRLAHEINNPLDFVQNNITFLSQQLPTLGLGPSDRFKQMANALLELGIGAGRLCKVSHALSRVASVDPRYLVPTEIRTLIETEAVAARDRTGFCGQIDVRLEDLRPLSLNPSLTRHVLQTALAELMHTANRLGQRSASGVNVGCRYADGQLVVELNVVGEAPPVRPRQEDLLSRALATGENSSLDLTICRSLLVAAGGDISCRWRNEGCVGLRVGLPARADDTPAS